MRAQHTHHFLTAFPVYCSVFLSPTHLVLGGGGGASKTGIKNKLRVYDVSENRSINLVSELELEPGDDSPTSIAANLEAKEQMKNGQNQNCRVFAFKDQKLGLVGTRGTLVSGDLDDFQKVTALSPDGKFVVAAGTSSFQLLSFPSLEPVAPPIKTDKEIYDVTFSPNLLVVATTANLLVYALPGETKSKSSPSKNKKKGKQKESAAVLSELELLRTVDAPAGAIGSTGSTFRAAKFHPEKPEILYTVSNTIPARSRTKKAAPMQAFVCKWNTATWNADKVRKVGDKGLTCFDISANGSLLAFGSADCSVGILDANTLAPLVAILKAHEFPPTTVKFNPTSSLLVSASADNSIRVIGVPDSAGKTSWGFIMLILITLFIALLAFAAQQSLLKL
ncbi:WD-REPEATS-REGION domain-containing protein [Mycena sanguinolenta]|uniref:WD-REPEATS-REGION domain-containing protein n=1 Tax=Mycena sanguinolenta TaxID=230812 RepID=A0A8H6Y8G3_9AGAR|nr:WD-REPEATS-REGION domain-containing protein [Mycena sanguinolenta]